MLDERGREFHRAVFDVASLEQRGLITGQVDRHTLRQALLDGLGRRVQFGKTFVAYQEQAGGVAAQFEDGSSAAGDVLVGADGTHSRVRRQRLPDAEPRDTGIRAIFGRTYVSAVSMPLLGPMLADGGIMAVGPHGAIFFCTSMRFRELPAVVAARMGIEGAAWPTQDYFMWAVVVRKSAPAASPAPALDAQSVHALAAQAVERFHDDFHGLVQHAHLKDLILVPICAAPTPRSSRPSRITLIGDAVHTMPPFGAHGANTALRDARTLAAQLAGASNTIESAVGAYESEMQGYSARLVRSSVRTMTVATADFPLKQTIVRNAFRLARMFSRS